LRYRPCLLFTYSAVLQYVAHFNWDRRLEMLHDVAAGMSYLHGKDHVHGDLRSPNLFVGADGKVRLCF
jgi:DNA-binding helix-hairpin-helix protein with protein kinase domain